MSHTRGSTIPFAWENKPGISKVVSHKDDDHQDEGRTDLRHFLKIKELPPPPVPSEKAKVLAPELQIPLPPLAFQPPLRSSSKKGLWKQDDDPFMTAYKECTKSTKRGDGKLFGSRKHKRIFPLSCISSCSVRDDSMVKISELPKSQSGRKDW